MREKSKILDRDIFSFEFVCLSKIRVDFMGEIL